MMDVAGAFWGVGIGAARIGVFRKRIPKFASIRSLCALFEKVWVFRSMLRLRNGLV